MLFTSTKKIKKIEELVANLHDKEYLTKFKASIKSRISFEKSA